MFLSHRYLVVRSVPEIQNDCHEVNSSMKEKADVIKFSWIYQLLHTTEYAVKCCCLFSFRVITTCRGTFRDCTTTVPLKFVSCPNQRHQVPTNADDCAFTFKFSSRPIGHASDLLSFTVLQVLKNGLSIPVPP